MYLITLMMATFHCIVRASLMEKLTGTLKGTEPLLMLSITPVLFTAMTCQNVSLKIKTVYITMKRKKSCNGCETAGKYSTAQK